MSETGSKSLVEYAGLAREALARGKPLECHDSVAVERPGLYAVHAGPGARRQLKVKSADSLLYLGKAESSLRSRDVKSHFATGRTGQSTLRRSLAALLARELGLVPVSRGTGRNALTHYALESKGDNALTEWMSENLTLAIWPKPAGCVPLSRVERHLLIELDPPLNLTHVPTPRRELKAARADLARYARRGSQ